MRKSSLILLLAMAFVLTTVVSGFSATSTIIDGPCKELCTKCWKYNLLIDDEYVCDDPEQGEESEGCPLCPVIDYEGADGYCGSNYPSSTARCPNGTYYNAPGVVFKVCECPDYNSTDYDETKSYGIKIEIMEPASGVYFTNYNLSAPASCTYEDECGVAAQTTTNGQFIYVSSVGNTAYEPGFCPEMCADPATPFRLGYKPLVDGQVLFDKSTHDPVNGDECCLDCVTGLTAAVITTCEVPFMRDGSPYLMVDMPTYVWDPKVMTAGDEVIVKITIVGEDGGGICPSCNDLCSCTVKIGEFGCGTGAPPSNKCKLCFPYFVELDSSAGWWSGLALTNSGSDVANVTMTFYAGGSSATVTKTVPAYSVETWSVGSFVELDALPNKPMYANVTGTVPSGEGTKAASISGVVILGDNTQAYGYTSTSGFCGCEDCCE